MYLENFLYLDDVAYSPIYRCNVVSFRFLLLGGGDIYPCMQRNERRKSHEDRGVINHFLCQVAFLH